MKWAAAGDNVSVGLSGLDISQLAYVTLPALASTRM